MFKSSHFVLFFEQQVGGFFWLGNGGWLLITRFLQGNHMFWGEPLQNTFSEL